MVSKDDVRLTNNDVGNVPNRKNTIEVKGELQNSAIYEILENEDLTTLVEYLEDCCHYAN